MSESEEKKEAHCRNCGHKISTRFREKQNDDWPLVQEVLPELFKNPDVTLPINKIKRFNNSLKELLAFSAWVCGVDYDKLCTADMVSYIRKFEQKESHREKIV